MNKIHQINNKLYKIVIFNKFLSIIKNNMFKTCMLENLKKRDKSKNYLIYFNLLYYGD